MLPAITTQTDRARYYSLYCWILRHIHEQDQPRSGDAFVKAFQRRDAAVAIATLLGADGTHPVGVRAVEVRVARAKASGQISTDFAVLPSNRLGAFGQYYSGCLYELGLTQRLEDGLDRLTPGMAEDLARVFQDAVSEAPYLRQKGFEEATVPLNMLKRSSERLGLDGLSRPFASQERRLLINLFFGLNVPTPSESTIRRRGSLARVLQTVSDYMQADIPVLEATLSDQLLFGPSYFGVLVDSRDRPKNFVSQAKLQRPTHFWRQFCLQQFLTQALEGVLQAVIDAIAGHPGGATLDEVLDELTDSRFAQYLHSAVGRRCATPKALMAALQIGRQPDEAACVKLRSAYPYNNVLSEWFCHEDAGSPPELVARSCVVLAILYGKWRGIQTDVSYLAVAQESGNELSSPNVLPLLDSWFDGAMDWRTALRIACVLVIKQHDQVMYGKGRLESCWLRHEEGRYYREQDCTPYFRESRHKQAVSILADLGLLRWVGTKGKPSLVVSAEGRDVLRRSLSEGV
ncbi:MAG: hypothetical protein Q8T13_17145 [Acidobacteriota bacterium]|nr:hypothetical protein [Acidobacteriota bacterium]